MNNLYLNTKQILFLILPLLFMAYLSAYPKTGVGVVNTVVSFVSESVSYKEEYSKLTEESIKHKYYMTIDKMKNSYNNYDKSLYEINTSLTHWIIAYGFKHIAISPTVKEIVEPKAVKGKIGQLNKIQKMVDKRNENIQATLTSSSTNSDVRIIKELIKKRNLKGLKSEAKLKAELQKLDINKYSLQMILLSKTKSEVIINNEIYYLNQTIDDDVRIIKIEDNKVLLTNKKEKRWLKLIK